MQRVHGERRDHERRDVEVQREHDLALGHVREVVDPAAEELADELEQDEEQRRDRRRAVGGEQAEPVGLLELVGRHQVGDRRVLGRSPEQRGAAGQELGDVEPGQLRREPDDQVDRDGQVEHGPDHVADDQVDPPVEPVGHGARQRAEQQVRQQRGDPDAADRDASGRGVAGGEDARVRGLVAGQRIGQRGQREQAQPVPQAGQRRRYPDPPEWLDGQHTFVVLPQLGPKAHYARLSTRCDLSESGNANAAPMIPLNWVFWLLTNPWTACRSSCSRSSCPRSTSPWSTSPWSTSQRSTSPRST